MNESILLAKRLEQIKQALERMGCLYAIVDQQGNQHGTLKVEMRKKKQMNPDRAYGEMKAYVEQYLSGIGLDEIREVPFGKYPVEDVRSAACNYLGRIYGNGTYTSCLNKAKQCVEIMRMERLDG